MKYTVSVHMLDTHTGESGVYTETSAHDEHEQVVRGNVEFQWSEGSYSCDCNRELFIARSVSGPIPYRTTCTRGRYAARSVKVDGVIVYEEL